tara:strand:- start:29 stop:841 length:813 start_codon:yes stop_codon:yes gene_type:complete
MRSFLGESRKRHIGAFKTYLPYAIGEIFLVVVGILIAIEVNNYNDIRKERAQEEKVLLSLHYEIANNIRTLDRSIEEKQKIVDINQYILHYTGPDANWHSDTNFDSLMYYISVSGWIYVPDDGVLNEIIHSGKLSIISDDRIKKEIVSLPQLLSLIREEDRLYRDDLHQYFLPFLSKNYTLRSTTAYRSLHQYSKSDVGATDFTRTSSKLLSNREFENILTIQAIWIKFSLDMCKNQRLKFSKLQQLIEAKYPHVDFTDLHENMERGFWG